MQCNINICMDRELILEEISSGSFNDDQHIARCLDLVNNEPDDLIRVYARLWLEHNSLALARRLISQQESKTAMINIVAGPC